MGQGGGGGGVYDFFVTIKEIGSQNFSSVSQGIHQW